MFNGTIRRLQEGDIEAVEKIFDLYWSGDFRDHLFEHLHESSWNIELTWWVAEENGEVVGVAATRKAPERMREYTKTLDVIEFYIAAVKYKGKGIGTALRNLRIENARKQGYKEAVFFSGDTHQDSWSFHDHSQFKRIGESIAPNGEKGQIWLMDLK